MNPELINSQIETGGFARVFPPRQAAKKTLNITFLKREHHVLKRPRGGSRCAFSGGV